MSPLCHHLSVNRTDRLYALREELRRAGAAGRSAERLAQEFEVSVRTVKRDISALQQGGFPVWARPGPGGGYVVDANVTLPPVNLTDAEASGLAAAVAAHRGQPFEHHARAALLKVLDVMDTQARRRAAALADRVWIDQPAPARARSLRAVEQALRDQTVLGVTYRDRGVDASHSREVDPVLLAHTRDRWYLVGRCRAQDEIVWIEVDRITSARALSTPADPVPVQAVGTPPASAARVVDL